MYLRNEIACCGIRELHGIDYTHPGFSARAAVEAARDAGAHVFFSSAYQGRRTRKQTNGAKLAAYILRHKLGSINEIPVKINRNSGNRLAMWVWTPNRARLNAFLNRAG